MNNEGVQRYYSNIVGVGVSVYDFKLTFGNIKDDNNANLDECKEVEVVMSPQHAKAFIEILADHLRAYEDRFGTVNITPISE